MGIKKHPTQGVEPYGLEASERNSQLVEGKTVYLEKDVSETDRFGRLLEVCLCQWLDGQCSAGPRDLCAGSNPFTANRV